MVAFCAGRPIHRDEAWAAAAVAVGTDRNVRVAARSAAEHVASGPLLRPSVRMDRATIREVRMDRATVRERRRRREPAMGLCGADETKRCEPQ